MADQIVTPELTLSAEIQLALVNGMNGLRNQLASPATDMGAVLAGAELLLERYKTSIEPFVLSGSQTLVGKAGVVLGMGQLASAIGDLKAGKSFGQVYGDLATSLSGMVGSTGLMLEAYAGVLDFAGNTAAAKSVLKLAVPMNQLGMSFTVGTVIGTIISNNLPDDVNMAIGGTLYEMKSMIQVSINELIGSSSTSTASSFPTTISGDWVTKDFGSGITQQVLINPLGGVTSTPPNTLPDIIVTATTLNPRIVGTWSMHNADGTVTKIGYSNDRHFFTIEQKSDATPTAISVKSSTISIDAGGVHNTTFNKDGWTTVTTDPVTRQITSNSAAVIQTDGNTLETVTYANGRIMHITTDASGHKMQEIVPTATESFVSTTATLIDAMSLIKAIQTGQPLPILASGLRVANDLTSIRVLNDPNNPGGGSHMQPTNASINGAANVAGGVLSLMSLDAALQRGDSMGAITAGAQTISYSASAYVSLSQNIADVTTESITGTFGKTAGSAINGLNTALPYLNIVNSIAHGDAMGVAMGVLALNPATAPIAWAYYAFQMVDSLFSDNTPPEAWGSAHAQWSGFTASSSAVGGFGGLEAASQTYNGMLSYLDQLAAQQQTLNPGSAIGIVANRLPSLSYRNYTGYQITDINPLTGVQTNPEIKYDLTGRPYNAPPGSVQAGQSLNERMIRVALERGALAPMWEVQTADCEAANDSEWFGERRAA